jgi:hypothetical protein
VYVIVRIVDEGRVGVCILCECDSDECDDGVGVGVNDTIWSETLTVRRLLFLPS